MMRRIFSLVVALGLAGLGPLPISACALAHSQQGECAAPQTKTQCERMAMEQAEKPTVTFSNASKSCCVISEAPLPEAQTGTGSFSAAAAPAVGLDAIIATQPAENAPYRDVKQDLSPPPLQSLLCTFLI